MEPSLLPALHDVLTVARTGSVHAAAAHLHKTPSAVSQQIRRVQEHFKVAFFERRGRGIRLSPTGDAALSSIVGFFDNAESLFQRVAELAGRETTSLRIAASDYLGERLLVPVIRTLFAEGVPLRFEITTVHSTEALRQVARGQVDFAVLSSQTVPGQLEQLPLFDQPFVWVSPHDTARMSLAERLRRGPLLRLAEGSQGRRLLDEHVERSGVVPASTIDLPSVSVLLAYARGGVGHGLCPGLAVGSKEPSLRVEPAELAPLAVRLLWRPAVRRSAAIDRFIEALAREASLASRHLGRRRRR